MFLNTGSVFDLPFALDQGLLELEDSDSHEIIRPRGFGEQAQAQHNDTDIIEPDSFITLPASSTDGHPFTRTVPLHAAPCLRKLVQPGRNYLLRLRGKDLGIQWYNFHPPKNTSLDA